MSFAASQNIPDALDRATALYRAGLARAGPAVATRAAERARHFAAATRFAILGPAAMNRLHVATRRLLDATSLAQVLPATLDGALELTGADFGAVQLVDPASTALRIVTRSGFDDDFVKTFAVVDDARTVCGLAVQRSRQVGTSDVRNEPGFAAHEQPAVVRELRAVLCTPLLDYAGNVLGVVSTCHVSPALPDALTLRLLELLADLAGERLSRYLTDADAAEPSKDDEAGFAALARAVISALLSPDGAGPPRSWDVPTGGVRPRPFRDAFPADEVSEMADLIVTRLFAVSLQLDGARSVLTDPQAVERLSAAAGDVDRLIDDVRTAMIARHARRLEGESGG